MYFFGVYIVFVELGEWQLPTWLRAWH